MAEKEMAPRTEANDAEPRDQTTPLYHAAITYAGHGWRVLPLHTDKSPYTRNGWKDSTTDPEQIRAWWEQYPDANVGIVTGVNPETGCGLLVIDIDVAHGDVDGSCTLNEWENEHEELPDTVTCNTGSGGTHYYYSYSADDQIDESSIHKCADMGVDIQIAGYVVAPPSIHENGAPYVWECPPEECEVAPVDDTVRAFIDYVRGDDSNDSNDSNDKTNDAQQDSGLPDTIPEGKRNTTITSLAGKLQYYGLPDGLLRDCVHAVNQTRCDPPLKSDEVDRTVNKAITYEKGKPRGANADASDDLSELKTVFYDPEAVKQHEPEIIQGALCSACVGLLTAPSKAGKTFLMTELALAVATGTKWLKWWCTQGNVYVVDCEMKDTRLWKRYRDVAHARELTDDEFSEAWQHIPFLPLRGHAHPITKLEPIIIREAQKYDCSLIILDPAYPIMTGDENAAGDVREFTNSVLKIANTTGAAVMYVHHNSKGSGDRAPLDSASGSGMFARTPDAIFSAIELVPTEEQAAAVSTTAPAFRMTPILRDFPSDGAFNMWFKKDKTHAVDYKGVLDEWEPESRFNRGRQKAGHTSHEKKVKKKTEVSDKINELIDKSDDGRIEQAALFDYLDDLDISRGTLRTYLDEFEHDHVFEHYTKGNKCIIRRF